MDVGANVFRVWLVLAHGSFTGSGKVVGSYCEYVTCPEVQVVLVVPRGHTFGLHRGTPLV